MELGISVLCNANHARPLRFIIIIDVIIIIVIMIFTNINITYIGQKYVI